MDDEDYFEVEITERSEDKTVVYENGQLKELPENENIWMSVSAIDPKYVYEDVLELLSPFYHVKNIQGLVFKRFEKHIKNLGLHDSIDSVITLENRIMKLQHKLEAMKFHMNNFHIRQAKLKEGYKRDYTNSRIEYEELDPIFIYETESFLFQTHSALDIIAQIIALSIRVDTLDQYDTNLEDKITKSTVLSENLRIDIAEIVNKNLVWYIEFNSMRNLITHWGNLLNFKSLIHHTTLTQKIARISYPKMPNGMMVVKYMEYLWNTLRTMIHDIYLVLIRIQANNPN